MKLLKLTLTLMVITLIFSGFWSTKSEKQVAEENHKEKVNRVKSRNDILQQLYMYDPETRNSILRAYGYAAFSNVAVHLAVVSIEGGAGVAHNNRTGENIYMNMASVGVGPGIAVKDFSSVFLFKDKKIFDSFVNSGWEANAQIDATLKAGDTGGAINGTVTAASGVRLYKITQNGIALQATLQGSKYWKDDDLN